MAVIKKTEIAGVGESVKKLKKTLICCWWNVAWFIAALEENLAVFQKVKYKFTI